MMDTQLYKDNRNLNLNGYYDKIWEKMDFSTNQRNILLAGGAVVAENDSCSARYQFTQSGDLAAVIVRDDEVKCIVFDRKTGERHVDFYVRTLE